MSNVWHYLFIFLPLGTVGGNANKPQTTDQKSFAMVKLSPCYFDISQAFASEGLKRYQ